MKYFIFKLLKHNEVNLIRHSNNFDFLRLFAASLVLIAHSPHVLNLDVLSWDPFSDIFSISMGRFGVLIFFIISGFLVTMSWEKKKNIIDFFLARFLRIYPALIVIVILCVFILGPLLTTKTISEYSNHDLTNQYIQNLTIFRMYYYLPGVFEFNPTQAINASLWTLPYELACYVFLGFIGFLYILRKKTTIIIFFSLLLLIELFFYSEIRTIVIPIIGIDFKTFYPLFLYFISGSIFFILKKEIKFTLLGLILSIIILYSFNNTAFSKFLSLILLPYIVLTIAFYKPLSLNKIGKYGDFSYGLYLYTFPIQQLIVYIFDDGISLFTMTMLSFLFTFPLAYLSWHIIEKPSLQIRNKFNKIKLFTTKPKLH